MLSYYKNFRCDIGKNTQKIIKNKVIIFKFQL